MSRVAYRNRRGWIASVGLLGAIVVAAGLLAAWKSAALHESEMAAASQPEPMEAVSAALAEPREYHETATAIGTVVALQSITLRNEVAGTVRQVRLTPGRVVGRGEVLVGLDVSVEEAELDAQQAHAALTETMLIRLEKLRSEQAASQEELDQARAEREVALAQVARTKAIIARKTIRAPFRAVVGISDVHVGQYLNEGSQLTTLQGVADAANVDFAVSQQVAAGLRAGQRVEVWESGESSPIGAVIVAVDARVDPTTRNATVRARLAGKNGGPAPGASVRVVIPVGRSLEAVAIPASAVRKGPEGDHVFVLSADRDGKTRAHVRPVRAGPIVGDDMIILDGLQPGEQIAASGSFKLREGVLIGLADAQPAAQAAK